MADATTIDIARATSAEVPALRSALAHAFQEDPVFRWLVPDADERRASLPSVFEAFADVYLPHDECYLAGDGAGAAFWAPAGVDPFDEATLEVFGRRLTDALGDHVERAFELEAVLGAHHPDEACAYLQFMGVMPGSRGRGLGSRMLETVLRRCDDTGTPAYLEATSRDNRRLYERHGFTTVSEITVPDGPTLWAMWRDPVRTGD